MTISNQSVDGITTPDFNDLPPDGGLFLVDLSQGVLTGSVDNSQVTWNGGTVSNLTLNNNSILLAINNNLAKIMLGELNNRGLVRVSTQTVIGSINNGKYLTIGDNSNQNTLINNQGTFELVGNNSNLLNIWGRHSAQNFNNQGTLKRYGDGSSTIYIPFSNTGKVEVLSGTLVLTENSSHRGTYVTETGTVRLTGGTHTLGVGLRIIGNNFLLDSTNAVLTGNLSENRITWNTGTVDNVTVGLDGQLTVSSVSTSLGKVVVGDLINQGTIQSLAPGNSWSIGSSNRNAVVNNEGTFELVGNNVNLQNGWNRHSAQRFNNQGLFQRSGAGTSTISIGFNNTGVVDVTQGTLAFTGDGTHGGTYIAEVGEVRFTSGTQTLLREFQLTGNNFFLDGTTAVLTGNLNNNRITWNTGTVNNLTLGTRGQLTVSSAYTRLGKVIVGDITNRGTIQSLVGGDGLSIGSSDRNAVVNNEGTFELSGNNVNLQNGWNRHALQRLNNQGTLRRLGAGTSTVFIAFSNTGTVDVKEGILAFAGDSTHRGTYIAEAGEVRFTGGTHTLGEGLKFQGNKFSLDGGTLTGNLNNNGITWNSGVVNNLTTGDATLSIPGNTNNNRGQRVIGKLNNNGRVIYTAAQGNSLTIGTDTENGIINNGGTFELVNNNSNLLNGWNRHSEQQFNNQGTLKRYGAGTSTVYVSFNNTGTVEVQEGTLAFAGNTTHRGTYIVETGEIKFTAGTHSLTEELQIQGNRISVDGGLVTGDFKDLSINWNGGTISNLTVVNGATLVILGNNVINPRVNNTTVSQALIGNLINEGTVRYTSNKGNTFSIGNDTQNAMITNRGTFELIGDLSNLLNARNRHSTQQFNNEGIFRRSGGGTSTIYVPFTNTGTVEVHQGTLTFSGLNYVQSSGTTFLKEANLTFAGGSAFNLGGGTLTGSGTITGNISNGGVVSPGDGIGVLNLGGNYTQGATGVLNLEIGGRQLGDYDQFNITGDISFNGRMNISLVNGFVPQVGDRFEVLRYRNQTGLITVDGLSIARGLGFDAEFGANSLILKVVQVPDPKISMTATNAIQLEGDSGIQPFTFTITRTDNTRERNTVNWSVRGSGTNPVDANDFGGTFPSGTITFEPAEVTRIISVNVSGDSRVERDETFTVNLSNPSNDALIINGTATGQVINDDIPVSAQQNLIADPGQTVTMPLFYSRSTENDFDVIGLRLYYNSNDLTYQNARNIFDTRLFGTVSELVDVNDSDNDPNTDRYLKFEYVNPSQNLPSTGEPLKLVDFNFATSQDFSGTQLNLVPDTVVSGYDVEKKPIFVGKREWNFDIDGDGKIQPLSDGVMAFRYMLNGDFPGDSLIGGAISSDATRNLEQIRAYLKEGADRGYLDIDGNGKIEPLSDGIMAVRYMFRPAFSGQRLIQDAIAPDATRDLSQIQAHLAQFNTLF